MNEDKEAVIIGEATPDIEELVGNIFNPVRTIIHEQKIWYAFDDLYKQIIKGNGFKKNSIIANIPEKWKTIQEYPVIDTTSPNEPFFQGRGEVEKEEQMEALIFINPKAIFLLCLWIVSPQTQAFQEWLAGELLPALMIQGCYQMNGGLDAFLKKYGDYLNTKFYEDKKFTFEDGTVVVIRKCDKERGALFIFGGPDPQAFPYETIPEISTELDKYAVIAGPFYINPETCQCELAAGGKE